MHGSAGPPSLMYGDRARPSLRAPSGVSQQKKRNTMTMRTVEGRAEPKRGAEQSRSDVAEAPVRTLAVILDELVGELRRLQDLI